MAVFEWKYNMYWDFVEYLADTMTKMHIPMTEHKARLSLSLLCSQHWRVRQPFTNRGEVWREHAWVTSSLSFWRKTKITFLIDTCFLFYWCRLRITWSGRSGVGQRGQNWSGCTSSKVSDTSFFFKYENRVILNDHNMFLSLAMDLFYIERVHSHNLILTCSCSRVKELFIFFYNLCMFFLFLLQQKQVVDQHAKVLTESVDSYRGI